MGKTFWIVFQEQKFYLPQRLSSMTKRLNLFALPDKLFLYIVMT